MKIHFGKNESKYNKAPSVKESEIWSQGTGDSGAIKVSLKYAGLENIPQMVEEKNADDVFYGCCGLFSTFYSKLLNLKTIITLTSL